MTDSFPRQKARTRNFTLGEPRSFQVAADGSRVTFLRSSQGDDPRNALWAFDSSRLANGSSWTQPSSSASAAREDLARRAGAPRTGA